MPRVRHLIDHFSICLAASCHFYRASTVSLWFAESSVTQRKEYDFSCSPLNQAVTLNTETSCRSANGLMTSFRCLFATLGREPVRFYEMWGLGCSIMGMCWVSCCCG